MATITLPDFKAGSYLVLATRAGIIKKTPLEQFERVRSTGIRAIILRDEDELAWVDVSTGDDDVIIATAQGKLARFSEGEVRAMGRDSAGVIGIRLARKGDAVVGMSVVQPDSDLLVLSETGYGKRVPLTDFRRKHRGGQGVGLISLEGRKTGDVAAVQQVTEARRGAAPHQRRRPGHPDRDQHHQPLLAARPRGHRHAPRRRRPGGRDRRLPRRTCRAGRHRGRWRTRNGRREPGRPGRRWMRLT